MELLEKIICLTVIATLLFGCFYVIYLAIIYEGNNLYE